MMFLCGKKEARGWSIFLHLTLIAPVLYWMVFCPIRWGINGIYSLLIRDSQNQATNSSRPDVKKSQPPSEIPTDNLSPGDGQNQASHSSSGGDAKQSPPRRTNSVVQARLETPALTLGVADRPPPLTPLQEFQKERVIPFLLTYGNKINLQPQDEKNLQQKLEQVVYTKNNGLSLLIEIREHLTAKKGGVRFLIPKHYVEFIKILLEADHHFPTVYTVLQPFFKYDHNIFDPTFLSLKQAIALLQTCMPHMTAEIGWTILREKWSEYNPRDSRGSESSELKSQVESILEKEAEQQLTQLTPLLLEFTSLPSVIIALTLTYVDPFNIRDRIDKIIECPEVYFDRIDKSDKKGGANESKQSSHSRRDEEEDAIDKSNKEGNADESTQSPRSSRRKG